MPIWVSKSPFGLLQSSLRLLISQNISLNALNLKMPDCLLSFVFSLKILCIMKIVYIHYVQNGQDFNCDTVILFNKMAIEAFLSGLDVTQGHPYYIK